jgi:hypothetical protein
MSSTRETFRLQAGLRAWVADDEVCQREWDCVIPRYLV